MPSIPQRGARLAVVAVALTLVLQGAVGLGGSLVEPAAAHPGGTDASGCHVCRTNCARWGVPAGVRHCHGPALPAPPVVAPGAPPPPPAPSVDPAAANEQLRRLYLAYFRREPDAGGLAYWTGRMVAGLPLVAVSEEFARSVEFVSTYGALTSGDFVKLVYRNVLGREADAGGYSHWAPLVEGRALTRGAMMVGFSESPEFIGRVARGEVPGPR